MCEEWVTIVLIAIAVLDGVCTGEGPSCGTTCDDDDDCEVCGYPFLFAELLPCAYPFCSSSFICLDTMVTLQMQCVFLLLNAHIRTLQGSVDGCDHCRHGECRPHWGSQPKCGDRCVRGERNGWTNANCTHCLRYFPLKKWKRGWLKGKEKNRVKEEKDRARERNMRRKGTRERVKPEETMEGAKTK